MRKFDDLQDFISKRGLRMEIPGYPVYRINAGEKDVERVGSIMEFRRSRRSMNRIGLTKLAQRLFGKAPGDVIIVGYDSTLEREEIHMESLADLSAG